MNPINIVYFLPVTPFFSLVFTLVILMVDIMFALVDPRIRSQYSGRKGKGKAKQKSRKKEVGSGEAA